MYIHALSRHHLHVGLAACAILSSLLFACQPASTATGQPPAQPTAPTLPTAAPSPSNVPGILTLEQTVETIPAVPAGSDRPWWESMPQHTRISLKGYPVATHSMQPQIFIYPLADLPTFNENAAKAAADLNALLQNPQPVETMPFLPLLNSAQALHAQVKYIDFKNGKGVRYLTQFNQGPVLINNNQLIYSFQGLSSDNKYYIAAVLPVTHPELPANEQVYTQQTSELEHYPTYRTKMVDWLDQQPASSFTPSLDSLDALIQTIETR